MNCDEAQNLLTAHADGELVLPHAGTLEEHLRTCAACRGQLASITELRASLQANADYHAAPAGLSARIAMQLPNDRVPETAVESITEKPAKRPATRIRFGWTWPQMGAAFATVFALAWSAILFITVPGARESLENELVASHARALMADHALDVASSDRHTVKPWFNGKLDYSPEVIDLSAQGFPLTGGRLDYVAQRPVSALVYQHRQHVINLFVWPAQALDTSKSDTRQGFNLLHWTHNSMA